MQMEVSDSGNSRRSHRRATWKRRTDLSAVWLEGSARSLLSFIGDAYLNEMG
jgi:hypothetical protein